MGDVQISIKRQTKIRKAASRKQKLKGCQPFPIRIEMLDFLCVVYKVYSIQMDKEERIFVRVEVLSHTEPVSNQPSCVVVETHLSYSDRNEQKG